MNPMDVARSLVADLVVLDLPGQRPLRRVVLWLVLLTAYAAGRSAGIMTAPLPFGNDDHAVSSFNAAVNEVWCGKSALMSDVYSPGLRVVKEPSLASMPVEKLIERTAGSVKAYCDTVTAPFGNNENSVAMLDAAVLRLGGPSVTPVTIARALLGLRLAILLAFCCAAFVGGGSVLLCVGVFEIGLALCRLTLSWPLSLYPFIFVTPLLSICLYVWLLSRAGRAARFGDWMLLAGVGLSACFGANMRTSHLPAYLLMFVLFLWLWRPATWRHTVAAVVIVCAAYASGHWAIVTRRRPTVVDHNYSYHATAHPLVLSLAVPDNSLARREGIEWQDHVGLVLARRVDPSATYLGPSYERALFRYYASLWREHPRAMAGIYLWKFDVAGEGLVQAISRGDRAVWWPLDLWTMFGNGYVRLWVMIAGFIGSTQVYRQRRYVFAALVSMLTLVALLLYAEMAMIMPNFFIKYHNFIVFYAALFGLIAVQVAVTATVGLTGRAWGFQRPPAQAALIDVEAPQQVKAELPLVPLRISVIAPVYNESASIAEFLNRVVAVGQELGTGYEWEFVLVDDGSSDDSLRIAKGLIAGEPRLRVIELRRNFGQTAALQAGLAAARGDIVISMDSDLQHFPEDIPLFLAGIHQGYDLVCGWRHDRQEGVLRRWPSRAANLLIRRVAGVSIHDFGTTFRAYRSDLVRHIQLLGEQHRFVPALATQVGARVAEVKIRNIERPHGVSNYGLGRTLNVALDIIFLYFSRKYFTGPLKAFGKIALLLMSAGSGIAGSLLAYSWMTGIPTVRERGGWFLLSALLILASLQILMAGLLAEILVRIYYRTSNTDSYVIRDEWNRETISSARSLPGTMRNP